MDRTSLVSYQEQVVVIGLDGHIRILSEGSQPRNGEIIVERVSQSELKVGLVKDEQSTDISDDIAQIIETLESGQDPTQLSEEFATAAGTANGSSYQLTATLERSASEILATTDFQTSGLQDLGVSQTQTLSLLEAYLNFNQVISSASGNPDTLAPSVPTVVITEDSNNDGSLENNEVDGLVDVLVTLPANAEVGDTLSVTGQPDRVITQNDLDNGVTLQYPVPAEGETLTVVATITDQAGNTSEPGQDAVTVPTVETPDTVAPDAPTVMITEDSNNDGSLENNEVDGLVDVLVTLPANAEVGDTLSVTGQPDRVITQNDLDNGVTLQYPVPAEGETLTVVATITDQAGNTSEPGQDAVTVPVNEAPTASIDLDPIVVGNDNTINEAESTGKVTLSGAVGGDVKVGDTVTLALGENLLTTAKVVDLGNDQLGFSVDVDASELVGFDGKSVTASVTVTDEAGNSVEKSDTETYQVDVDAPTASIDLDPIVVGNDNTINKAESTGKVTLSGTVGGDVKVGDTVTLALGENLLTTAKVVDLGNDQLGFSVDVDASELVGFDGQSVTASVTVTDEAGNSVEKSDTETYLVDVDTPTASIDLDPIVVGNDNTINEAESTGKVTLSGTVGGDVTEDDKVQLKLGNNLLVEADVIDLGNGQLGFSVDVDASELVGFDGKSVTASVTVTDEAGNSVEKSDTETYLVDVDAPTASINLDPIIVGNDNTINEAESTGQVTLSGAVGGDVKVGDTVTLALGENLLTTAKVVDLGNDQLGFSVDVDASELVSFDGQSVTASVTVTDEAGNSVEKSDTETYQVDVDAPTASIDLDPIVVGNDNTINKAESTGKVTLSGTVGGDVKVGDTVTLTLGENLLTTAKVVDLGNNQVGFSVGVDASELVGFDGKSVTASVTVTDEAGNSVEKSDTETYLVDVDAPTASIDLDPIVVGDDNVINQAEATGQVTLTGTVGGEVVEGDTVQLKLGDNLLAEVEVIKLADGKLGFSADVDASTLAGFNDQSVTASVTITDGAGNAVTETDTETYQVDVDAPTASIDLDPIVVGSDNIINEAESTGKVTLSGTVGGDVKVGDTVTLALGENLLTTAKVVDLGNDQLGFSVDVDASELVGFDGKSVTASVTVTDEAGNSVEKSDTETYQVDVDAPTASIDLDPIVVGNDNTINEAESTGQVTLSGTVGGDVKVGDTVTLALGENLLTTAKVVDLGNDQLGFSVDVDASELVGFDGKSVTASVTVTDEAGNSVEKSDTETYQVDVDAPTASIDLDPIVVGGDNTINEAESTGKVTLSGTVGGDVTEDDKVQLKLGNNLLVEADVIDLGNGQLGFSVDVDASELVGFDGKSVTASVTVTDESGNSVEKSDTETYQVDVDAPTASIDLDPIVVGNDNTINEAEATGQVTLTGTVGGEVVEGDTVQLKLGDNLLAEVEVIKLADGKLGFSADVDASTLAGFNDQSVTASVTITDGAGNAVTETDTETYQVDVDAPTASIDLDPIIVGNDNTINEAESTGKVTLSGTVGGDVKVGDTVTLALGETLLTTVKVVDLGNDQLGFSVDVDASELVGFDGQSVTASVTVTDEAGNSVEKSDTETYQVDVDAPTASIDLDPIVVGDDNVINQAEATGQITLTGTVGGEVVEGDTVQLKLGDNLLAEVEVIKLADGKLGFSADVDASTLAGFNDQSVTASVTITDGAGNAVTETDTETYQVDVDAPTASIDLDPIIVGNDNTINEAESTGKVTLSGTVGGDVKVGDTVTLALGETLLTTVKVVDLGNDQLGFSVDVDASELVGFDGQSVTASVTVTDEAGNSVEKSDTETYQVDVDAPTASIDLDPIVVGGDNTINEAESTGKVTLSGTVGGDVTEDDKVQLKLGNNLLVEADVIDLGNGQLSFSVDVDASELVGFDGKSVTASVTVTDEAGNSVEKSDAETYQVDVDAPTASIDLDPIVVGNDNTINEAESTGKVTLSGTVGGDVKVGDTVILTLGETLLTTVKVVDLGNDQLGFSVDVDASELVGFDGKSVTASVTVTDEAGNSVEKSDTETYQVDVDAPTASIDLDPIIVGNDNTINEAESTGKVTLSGTVGGDVKVGDTVTLALGETLLTTVKVVDLGNDQLGFSVDVDASELVGLDGKSVTASVTVTDEAGNSVEKSDTETYQVDVDAPTASIDLDPIIVGNDNTINEAESTGKVTLSGTVGGDVKVGDTVTLALGETLLTTVKVVDLGNDQLGFSVDVDASELVGFDGQSVTASVTVTDEAGNSVEKSDTETYQVDVDAPTASINLYPIIVGNDNTINEAESTGKVTLSGTVGGDVKVGDTVTLALGENLLTTAKVVDLGNNQLGFSVDVDASELVGFDGKSVTASVTVTDEAGNSVEKSDTETYQVDVDAPTASIDLDPIVVGDDNTINEAEATGQVTLTGTVGGEVVEGDTVQLKLGDNLLAEVEVIKLADGKLGFSADVDASTLAGFNDQSVTASVTITDGAGNAVTETDTETYQVDVDAPTASIDLDPIVVGGDNTINEAESTGKVTLSGTVGGDVKVGDTVILTLGETLLTTVKVVDLGNDQLGFSVDVDASELVGFDGKSVTASVTVTDEAGNSVEKSDTETYQVDVDAPTASIDLDPIVVGGDNTINEAESTGKVTLSGTVGGDVKVGDTVILTLGETLLTTVKVVDLGNDQLSFSVDVDASELVGFDGKSVTASVTVTDEAGNSVEKSDTETYQVDVDAPTASIDLDPIIVGNDNTINEAESTGKVTLSGTVGGDVKVGDTVTLALGETLLTTVKVVDLGNDQLGFSVDVDASELVGFDGQSVTASVTVTDEAGNSVEKSDTETYQVDVDAPTASIDLDPIVVGDDNTINQAEATGQITLTGTVGGEVVEGDTVQLKLGDNLLAEVEVIKLADGKLGFSADVDASTLAGFNDQSVTASVTITDGAGNAVTETDTETYQVDVDAPTASIDLDPIVVGNDNTINQAEATGQVTLTGTVGGEVVEGDTVQLKLGDYLLAEVEVIKLADGKLGFSADVDASTLAGFNDQSVTASVTITDGAGNAVTETDTETYQVDVDAPTASIDLDPIVVGNDNTINEAESTGKVTLSGTVGGDVTEDDKVQLKLGNNLMVEADVIDLGNGQLGFSVGVDASELVGFDGQSVTASVTVTDEAGNSVEKSDTETYQVDVDAPTASIDLDPIVVGNDNTINEAEATGQVTLTGTVGGEVVEGDTVQLKLGDNLLAEVEVIKLADGKLGFSADVDASTLAGFNDQSVTASVTITDGAGNAVTATDTETYQVDSNPPQSESFTETISTTGKTKVVFNTHFDDVDNDDDHISDREDDQAEIPLNVVITELPDGGKLFLKVSDTEFLEIKSTDLHIVDDVTGEILQQGTSYNPNNIYYEPDSDNVGFLLGTKDSFDQEFNSSQTEFYNWGESSDGNASSVRTMTLSNGSIVTISTDDGLLTQYRGDPNKSHVGYGIGVNGDHGINAEEVINVDFGNTPVDSLNIGLDGLGGKFEHGSNDSFAVFVITYDDGSSDTIKYTKPEGEDGNTGLFQELVFDSPEGKLIASVDITTEGGGNWELKYIEAEPQEDTFDYKVVDSSGNYSNESQVTLDKDGLEGNLPPKPLIAAIDAEASSIEEGTNLVFDISLDSTTATQYKYPVKLGIGSTTTNNQDIDFASATFSDGVTYDAMTNSLIVPKGVDSFTITIPTVDDLQTESTEYYEIQIGDHSAGIDITDNETLTHFKSVEGQELELVGLPSGFTFPDGVTSINTELGGVVELQDGKIIYQPPQRDHSDEIGDQDSFHADVNGTRHTIQVDIADSSPVARNDSHTLDVVIDSFSVGGIEAAWSSVEGGTDTSVFDSNDNDSANDQLRWGTTDDSDPQSGYGFIDNDLGLNGELPLNEDVILGTFTHFNNPISSGTAITGATLSVSFELVDTYGNRQLVELDIEFDHNETPNDVGTGDDIVTITSTAATFNFDGKEYSVEVVGFKDVNGNVVTSINTSENQDTSYDLAIKLVPDSNYSEPSLSGNVYEDNGFGADEIAQDDVSVVSVKSSTGTVGAIGLALQGQYGQLTLNENGTYEYVINSSHNTIPEDAVESFTYTLEDSDGSQSEATISIDFNLINASEIRALDDTVKTTEGQDISGNLLDNDGETIQSVSEFSIAGSNTVHSVGSRVAIEGGFITIQANGQFVFEAEDNWNGNVPTITYVTDTGASARLNIEVEAVDSPTVTDKDSSKANEHHTATGNVLSNDEDIDSTLLVDTYSIEGVDGSFDAGTQYTFGNQGVFVLNENGSYSFTPTEHWSGDVPTITYMTNTGASNTLDIKIIAVADTPNLEVISSKTIAAIDFEDVSALGTTVDIDKVSGSGTVGVWETSNSGGKVEVNTEGTYRVGDSTNQVLELEGRNGDKDLFTDITCRAGAQYTLDFEAAIRSGDYHASDMVVKLYKLDASGSPILSSEVTVFDFYEYDYTYQTLENLELPIEDSGNYRVMFEAKGSDTLGIIIDDIVIKETLNTGEEGAFIALSEISASLVDTDNSERLTIQLDDVPIGTTLRDGAGNEITVESVPIDITGWDLTSLEAKFSQSGQFNLNVSAIATEVSNNDSAETSIQIPVSITQQTVHLGGAGVDTFELIQPVNNSANFTYSLGAHGAIGPQGPFQQQVELTDNIRVNSGDSNDRIDFGIGKGDYIIDTGSSLPNANGTTPDRNFFENSAFMNTKQSIHDSDGVLLQSVESEVQPVTDTVNLGSGDDVVTSQGGNLAAYGGDGNDTIWGSDNGSDGIRGGNDDDTLYGRAGDDYLLGEAGEDTISGGSGSDLLVGGLGNDILIGDDGADIFAWVDVENGAVDRIKDFTVGEDILDLSEVLEGVTFNEISELLDTIPDDNLEGVISIEDSQTGAALTIDQDGKSMSIEFDGMSAADLTSYLFEQGGLKASD